MRTDKYIVEYARVSAPTRDSDWAVHSSHNDYNDAVKEYERMARLLGTRLRIIYWVQEVTVMMDGG